MPNIIEFCLYKNIISYENGGGIRLSKSSTYAIRNCMFDNCTSLQNGGGIFINLSSVKITGCCFSQCVASCYPAIIAYGSPYHTNQYSYISTDSCSLLPDSDENNGSTICVVGEIHQLTDHNSTNNVVNHVSTIQIYKTPAFTIKYCNSVGNNASINGVCIQFHNITSKRTISYSNIVLNHGKYFPIIRFVDGDYNVNQITNANFVQNDSPLFDTGNLPNIINCFCDDSTYNTYIYNSVTTPFIHPTSLIDCVYKQTKVIKIIPPNILKFISTFILSKY